MNFKRFTLLSLSAVVLAGGGYLLQNEEEVKYFPRNNTENTARFASGYIEYLNSLKANQVTGDIDLEDVVAAKKQAQKMAKGKSSLNINWGFKGPDNVGGRTRAFIIDKNNSDHLLAGGVAGGVFESFDQGQTWNVYDTDYKIKNISTITQGADGSFYVGTGGHFEGGGSRDRSSSFFGSGIHKLTGNGNFEMVVEPSTRLAVTDWVTIGKIAADPNDANILYVAMNNGFRRIDMSGSEPDVTDPIGFNRRANDVDVTADGRIIVSYQGGDIFTSFDSGENFVRNSFSGVGRTEISIAPSNSNIVYASMTRSSDRCLFGIFRSKNGGVTWERISPQGSNTFDMFANSIQCQGGWDNTIAVYPNDPGKVIVGGITLYRWEQSSVDPAPANGSWNQIDVTTDRLPNGDRVPYYVHADKHSITFDPNNSNIAYITSDGGIAKSINIEDENPTYNTFNFNFRVTQFYNLGVNSNDIVLAGTQDNGSHIVGLQFNNDLGSVEVLGGDGFDADMSTINPSAGFASLYFNRVFRVQGIGTSSGNSNFSLADITSNNGLLGGLCATPEGCSRVFYTSTKLWESFDHQGSQDSVALVITEQLLPPMKAGRVITYESNNSNLARKIELTHTLSAPVFPQDTLFGAGADAPVTKNITEFNNLSLVTNFDTLTIDTASKVVNIKHPNGTVDNLAYTLGTPVSYNNEFFGTVTFEVSERTVNGSVITEFSYYDIQISFFYDLRLWDNVQSIFAIANWPGSGANYSERNLFITRDATNGATDIRWYCVAGAQSKPHALQNNDDVLSMEFSRDGNHLFIGTQAGRLFRVSDLNLLTNDSAITQDGVNIYKYQNSLFNGKCHQIGNFLGRAVTDIAVDPSNPDNVVVSLGNYGNASFIARTNIGTTAVNATGTFTTVQGFGSTQLPRTPAYTVMFDVKDPSNVYVGNELGVFVTENIFETAQGSDTVVTPAIVTIRTEDTVSVVNTAIHTFIDSLIDPLDSLVAIDTTIYFPADTLFRVALRTPDTTTIPGRTDITTGPDVKWTEETIGMGRVPVFDLEQMIHPWPYATNTGKIYAATHGRGIFELANFVGIGDVDHNEYKDGFKESLKMYPNPVKEDATIEFYLADRGSAQVQVFDIRGKLVKSQQLNSLSKGFNKVNLDFNELVNGTYIIRVINGSEVATNKFVLYK